MIRIPRIRIWIRIRHTGHQYGTLLYVSGKMIHILQIRIGRTNTIIGTGTGIFKKKGKLKEK